ncbi:MAG: hypothetical protein A4E53_03938 [Pelotomaculum sp. PtaB.Bin104]|nr:MAG: hypothetical protein A4E53_03938 [Pelotomaculum sp. PtaB.Bin104]
MKKHICIVGILVNQKSEHAPKVQQVLTKYGSLILHRSGIPYSACDRGIINLTMEASADELNTFVSELQDVKDIVVNSLSLFDDAEELNVCGIK